MGTSPFSEEETRILKNLVEGTDGILVHVDFHSFGQLILGPWAYSAIAPLRAQELDVLGKQLQRAIFKVNGQQYIYGRGANFTATYAASGIMSDWVFSKRILSFTIELRPKSLTSSTRNDFILDAKQIEPTGRETLAAVYTLLEYAKNPTTFMQENALPNNSKSNADEGDKGNGPNTQVAFAVGSSMGVVFLVLIITLIFFVIRRRRRGQRDDSSIPLELIDKEAATRFTKDSFSLDGDDHFGPESFGNTVVHDPGNPYLQPAKDGTYSSPVP